MVELIIIGAMSQIMFTESVRINQALVLLSLYLPWLLSMSQVFHQMCAQNILNLGCHYSASTGELCAGELGALVLVELRHPRLKMFCFS